MSLGRLRGTSSLARVRLSIALGALVVVLAGAGCGSSKHAETQATQAAPTPATTKEEPSTTVSLTVTHPATTLATPPPATTAAGTTTGAAPATTAPGAVVQQTLCPSEQQVGLLANFGHSRTKAGAQRKMARASHVGFKNLQIERRSCHNYAVVLAGLKNQRQGRALQREAATVDIHVTLECRSHPVQGGLAAVFGHRRAKHSALRLRRTAERYGFKGLQVQQDKCNDWEVDLYGLKTAAERRAFAREARSVGLRVAYEPG
jgi:hypothetical protein